jgi:hypothetical protein
VSNQPMMVPLDVIRQWLYEDLIGDDSIHASSAASI